MPRIYRSPGTNDVVAVEGQGHVVDGKRGALGIFLLEQMQKIEYSILPETNSLPLKIDPMEKEIPIGNHHFWGLYVSLRECKFASPLFLPETNKLKPETNIINGWLGDDP